MHVRSALVDVVCNHGLIPFLNRSDWQETIRIFLPNRQYDAAESQLREIGDRMIGEMIDPGSRSDVDVHSEKTAAGEQSLVIQAITGAQYCGALEPRQRPTEPHS